MPMRILMAATGDFAVPAFAALLDAGHEVLALITQPDRPAGRGRHMSVARIKQAALDLDIAVHQPQRIATPQAIDLVAEIAPDLLLVIAYGQKIPQQICDLPAMGAVNMHGSLLPELRGAAPCNWAVIRGYRETGVTVQHLAQTMDAGDVLASSRTAIGPRETAPELCDRLAVLGADLVLEVLRRIEAGTLEPVVQDEGLVSYAPRLKKEDGLVDWSRRSGEIDALVRGLKPWPDAYTYLKHPGKPQVRVILDEVFPRDDVQESQAAPGTVIESRKRLLVAAGSGVVEVARLKPESGRAMTGVAFCNGHQVAPGDTFGPSQGE